MFLRTLRRIREEKFRRRKIFWTLFSYTKALELWAKKIRQACQNYTLLVQRKFLRNKKFWKNLTIFRHRAIFFAEIFSIVGKFAFYQFNGSFCGTKVWKTSILYGIFRSRANFVPNSPYNSFRSVVKAAFYVYRGKRWAKIFFKSTNSTLFSAGSLNLHFYCPNDWFGVFFDNGEHL